MTDQTMVGRDESGRGTLPMAEIDRILRVSAVRQELVPIECRASWLVPVSPGAPIEPDGRLYLAGFLYPVVGLGDQPKRALRPRFRWTIDPMTGRIVEFTDASFRDFASEIHTENEVGVLTPDLLPAQTVPELEQFRSDVLKAYDRALPYVFISPTELNSEAREAVGHLKQLLERAIEPFLTPFYRALNPTFFEWLDLI